MTRFPPIADAAMDADQARMSGLATHTGPYPAYLRAPRLWEATQHVRRYLASDSLLEAPLREAAMLMAARHWRCTSAFASHRPLALRAGLSGTLVASIEAGEPDTAGADPGVGAALEVVRALLAHGGIDDALHGRAAALLGERGLVELTGLVGFFTAVCLTINLAGVSGEAGFGGAPGTYSPSGHNPDE
jgi:4-carboxymuconolactone decarboxylase